MGRVLLIALLASVPAGVFAAATLFRPALAVQPSRPTGAVPPVADRAGLGHSSSVPLDGQPTRPVPSLGANRRPHPPLRPGEVLDISIRDLGNFDYDADRDSPIPADVRALDGHPVRLRGYMVPLDQSQDVTRFALVPSLFTCCFGQPPQVQHTVAVICPAGKAVSYYPDEVVVLGQLRVAAVKDDGFVISVFSVTANSVKPTGS